MKSLPQILLLLSVVPVALAPAREIDFNRDIRPILSENCYFCHGPDEHERKADLRLDSYEGATAENDGVRAIDPADLAGSELLYRITTDDPDDLMPTPKSHKKLTPAEIELLSAWVKAGAPYADHWAFVTPEKPELPKFPQDQWARNPIDTFVLARLAEAGLNPAPEADPHQLIRRVTLDLTGLPPAPEETEAFVAAYAAEGNPAYGALVGRLLASEHFGERMTVAWMDAARYGDTSVMHADGPRDMWPWRDWVISSYNENKPFSDFLREQLAGDLIPEATREQKIATGFNRNNATSDEGGAFAEELRIDYNVDRVQTTANVFLGLSMECAQCHDHKYDPISQREYYGFFAYFNNNADKGMQTRKGNEAPVVKFLVGVDEEVVAELDARIAEVNKGIAERRKAGGADLKNWLASVKPEKPLSAEPAGLAQHLPCDQVEALPETGRAFVSLSEREGSKAYKFDGKGEVVLAEGAGPSLHLDKPFTVSYWIKVAAKTPTAALISDFGADFRGWDLWLQDRRPATHLIQQWPGNALKVVAKNQIAPDKWQHVSLSYDGSRKAAGLVIRVNGKKQEVTVEKNNLSADAQNNNDQPVRIGGRAGDSRFKGELDDLRFYDRVLDEAELGTLYASPFTVALATPAAERTKEQTKVLTEHFYAAVDGPSLALAKEKGTLDQERKELMKDAKEYSSMIMGDLPAEKMRKTYVLDRGQYDSPKKDEVIAPGVPAFLPPLPEGAPANRLGLAEWMLRPDHPLTARVAMNRYWAMLLGQGLTPSITDFGNQGQSPSHPELLDWLARDFVDSGWDIKHALRQIVTSATYRQSSAADPAIWETDPENLLLARAPRFRLQGEFIRDFALAASGLLNPEVGGPGAKPYQPAGLWNEVSINKGLRFVQDKGEKLYRKSMYIYWKRSSPPPSMSIFDAPSREKCVVQRARTNTPLQALVTLNDIQFVEASRKLAARMAKEGGAKLEDRIRRAYEICVSRPPTAEEQQVCREVYEAQLASFEAEPERATKYLAHGESPRDESLPPAEHAALTVLANLILNLDETLTRG